MLADLWRQRVQHRRRALEAAPPSPTGPRQGLISIVGPLAEGGTERTAGIEFLQRVALASDPDWTAVKPQIIATDQPRLQPDANFAEEGTSP